MEQVTNLPQSKAELIRVLSESNADLEEAIAKLRERGIQRKKHTGFLQHTSESEDEMADEQEEIRFREALKVVDFKDALNKEFSSSAAKHRPDMINYGKFYMDSRRHGFRKAVLNVADDLAL